jgi:hypothetical protein
MSLSLIMTARSNVSERLYFFDAEETAPATVRHCDGVQAGVCQRIFSFTAQIVLVRQSAGAASSVSTLGAAVVAGVPGEATTEGAGAVEARAPVFDMP